MRHATTIAAPTYEQVVPIIVASVFSLVLFAHFAFAAPTTPASSVASSTPITTTTTAATSTSTPTAAAGVTITVQNTPDISSITTASTTATTTIVEWNTLNQLSGSQVVYGTSTNDYTATSTGVLSLEHSIPLAGLTPDTTYHFEVSSSDGFGTSVSPDQTFTTAPAPPPPQSGSPTISDVTVIPTYSIATISWTTDQPANAEVFYGLTPDYSASTTGSSDLAQGIMMTDHVISLTNLAPSTTYHFEVVSENANGLSATSTDQTFTTPADPTS